jgi:DNA helicase-2/ATP-dependent DNA helicase PcrA
MSQLFSNLNTQQEEICKYINGPNLILAGAGSGKTRVLTTRIAHLIQDHQINPWKILAVTFTNKAAAEMRERVEKLVSNSISGMWIGTFHSTCARILRTEATHLGYNSNFTIYDQTDAANLVKKILTDLKLNIREYPPKKFYYQISKFKNDFIQPTEVGYRASFTEDELTEFLYYKYEKEIKNNNAFDFDDLIVKIVKLFQEFPEVREKYQKKFEYVLVDEYQDTNLAQYKLVKLISDRHHNITVVGDEDQSIYQWRGADIRNILEFEKDFRNAKIFKLEQNYRSTQQILSAANEVVRINTERIGKELWTEKNDGEKITIIETDDDRQEAEVLVTELLKEKQKRNLAASDCVILYRTNAQSRAFEEIFRKNNLAYQVVGGQKFFDRKEIKDILAYLRLVVNSADNMAFQRIVNFPARGIGQTTISKLISYADMHSISAFDAIEKIENIQNLNSRAKSNLTGFRKLIDQMISVKDAMPAYDFSKYVLEESGILDFFRLENTVESEGRIENLSEFLSSVKAYSSQNPDSTIEIYLQDVQLLSDIDSMNEDLDRFILMTMHSAKGLEFPLVFIAGMEEGLFPHENSSWNAKGLEEERRLFYVGITRAMDKLFLTWAKQRRRAYGNITSASKSQFIAEIPDKFFEIKNLQKNTYDYSFDKKVEKDFFEDDFDQSPELRTGMMVEHTKFGRGILLQIDGRGDNAKLTVQFEEYGIKKLIAKFAKLTPVELFD